LVTIQVAESTLMRQQTLPLLLATLQQMFHSPFLHMTEREQQRILQHRVLVGKLEQVQVLQFQ
jgi:hypothetical protein